MERSRNPSGEEGRPPRPSTASARRSEGRALTTRNREEPGAASSSARGSIDEPEASSILVGIPAYDEAEGIGPVVRGARRVAAEVVVVDDGSSDGTGRLARAAGATVLAHDANHGKGAAVRTLLEYAAGRDCRALVLIDGDGQHRPAAIPRVARPVLDGEADLVVGSRYASRPDGGETPAYRRVGHRIFDALTRAATGARTSDSQSGFRALSPRAVEGMELRTSSFGVESEMFGAAARADLAIDEVPIEVRYDDVAVSSTRNPILHGLSVTATLSRLALRTRPVAVTGLLAGVVLLLATTAMVAPHASAGAANLPAASLGAIVVAVLAGVLAVGSRVVGT